MFDATDDVTPDVGDTQICTELWKLSDTAIACVEMVGSVERNFSTGDTTDDFILDYVEYQMHAKFGNTGEPSDEVFRFEEQTVNFQDFLATETNFSLVGLSGVSIAAAASLFALGY